MTADLLAAAAVARLETASAGAGHELSVAVVVHDFTPAAFIRATVDFAYAVPKEKRDAWHRSFTRTVFLAGRPESVATRHPGGFHAGGLAWYGPAPAGELRAMSRLLKAFQGPAPVDVPATVTLPGTGHAVEAAVAIDGISTRDYLVHVHHLFAEATLRGLIRPGDSLRVRHVPDIDDPGVLDPARADTTQTRITHDNRDPAKLRLYAVLTSGDDGR